MMKGCSQCGPNLLIMLFPTFATTATAKYGTRNVAMFTDLSPCTQTNLLSTLRWSAENVIYHKYGAAAAAASST